jgi:hypothetical protein
MRRFALIALAVGLSLIGAAAQAGGLRRALLWLGIIQPEGSAAHRSGRRTCARHAAHSLPSAPRTSTKPGTSVSAANHSAAPPDAACQRGNCRPAGGRRPGLADPTPRTDSGCSIRPWVAPCDEPMPGSRHNRGVPASSWGPGPPCCSSRSSLRLATTPTRSLAKAQLWVELRWPWLSARYQCRQSDVAHGWHGRRSSTQSAPCNDVTSLGAG